MTRKTLKDYRAIRAEVVSIKLRLKEIREEVSACGIKIDGLPNSSKINKPTEDVAVRLVEAEKKYSARLRFLLAKEKEINEWLNSIDDLLVVSYVRLKYFQCLDETEIETVLYCSRSTLWRRLEKHLESCNK